MGTLKRKAKRDDFMAEQLQSDLYDVVIIGGGPAGYTAALYATRAGLSTLLLEKLAAGGQMALTHQIDNYPGFPKGIDGFMLGQYMKEHAENFGAKTRFTEVTQADLLQNPKRIITDAGEFLAKTVVIATGANPKKLGIDKEDALTGKGVHYCAACDGMFYRSKTVAVIGGGDSAVADALVLSRMAEKVYLIHRRDTLRATKIYYKALEEANNIQILWNTEVTEFLGDNKISGISIKNTHTKEETQLDLDGVFISIGRQPATDLFEDSLDMDQNGYLISEETTCTNIPGVYAAGDVRTKLLRQVVTAVADGAMAVHQIEEYLSKE